MRKDRLAAGAKTETYTMPITHDSQVVGDLKILDEGAFRSKYLISAKEYAQLVEKFSLGEAITLEAPKIETIEEVPSVVDNSHLFAKKATEAPKFKAIPIGDTILVKRERAKEMTDFGIIIPQTAQAKTDTGIAIAVGSAVKEVKAGNHINFDRFAAHGREIELFDGDHVIIRELDVLLVLEPIVKE